MAGGRIAFFSLTRDEWNAAYYLGLEEILNGEGAGNLATQLARGLARLASAGHRFDARDPTERARDAGKVLCSMALSEHRKALGELRDGSFDAVARAREALRWLRHTVPAIRTAWLEWILSVYETTHPRDAAPAPAPEAQR